MSACGICQPGGAGPSKEQLRPLGAPRPNEQLMRCPDCAALYLLAADETRALPPEAALRWIRAQLHQRPDLRDEAELVPALDGLLEGLRPSPDGVPALIAQLSCEDSDERSQAADQLGRIGAAAGAAVPALCVALHDADQAVRFHTAWALGRIGGNIALTALLVAAQEMPEPAVARALARLGAGVIPRLCMLLEHEQPATALVGTWALALIGPEAAARALPVLRGLLRAAAPPKPRAGETAWSLWDRRIWALGRLGDDDEDLPYLIGMLREHHAQEGLRAVLARALALRGAAAVEALVELLADPDWQLRWRVTGILGGMGALARGALPALKMLRKDPQPAVCEEATHALKAIRAASKAAR